MMDFHDFFTSPVISQLEWYWFCIEWEERYADTSSEHCEMVKASLWARHLKNVWDSLYETQFSWPIKFSWNVEQFEAHWIEFENFWRGLKAGQIHPFAPPSIVVITLEYREWALWSFLLDALIDEDPEFRKSEQGNS